MQSSAAVYVGIGTVVVAIAVGLSGGLIANVVRPGLKQEARLEQPAPPNQMRAPDAVPYVAPALPFTDRSIGDQKAATNDDQKAATNDDQKAATNGDQKAATNGGQKAAAGSNPAPQAAEAPASGDQAAEPAGMPVSTSRTEGPRQGATENMAPDKADARARAGDPRRGAGRRRVDRVRHSAYRHHHSYRYSYDQQRDDSSSTQYGYGGYRQRYYPSYNYQYGFGMN